MSILIVHENVPSLNGRPPKLGGKSEMLIKTERKHFE